jgi:hypothetical protein
VNEGVYLTLDLNDSNDSSESSVYFFDTKLADSLKEFVKKIDEDGEFLNNMFD